MRATVRLPAVVVIGLVLLSSCGNDGAARNVAVNPPDTSAVTTSAQPTPTTSAEQSSTDPVGVTLYEADFTVNATGDLAVMETLTLDVPIDDRHGISRRFDADIAVVGFTATLDGSTTPIISSVENGSKTFRIGDPDRTLNVGTHMVRIKYRVADVLTAHDDDQGFDWLLIPAGWAMDIQAARLTVNLPSDARDAECTIGTSQPCEVVGLGTRMLKVTTEELPQHTPVRLQVRFPKP